ERADRALEMRGILVAEDDEFLVLLAFRLDPVVAAARTIGRVAPLRDHAFEAEPAGVREHLRAADLEMIAVAHDTIRIAIFEQALQRGLAREQRLAGQVRAIEMKQIERIVDEARLVML